VHYVLVQLEKLDQFLCLVLLLDWNLLFLGKLIGNFCFTLGCELRRETFFDVANNASAAHSMHIWLVEIQGVTELGSQTGFLHFLLFLTGRQKVISSSSFG
jgi:hypothetical protein